MLQEPITRWESVATTRWGQYTTKVERQAILEAHRLAGGAGTALEVGCEGGRWSKFLADLGWTVTCTDVDTEALAICQRRVPAARCILVRPDDVVLPCDSASLSLLLCIEVYPVLESDWFLPEARRVLAQDGLLLGVASNSRSVRGWFVRSKERIGNRGGFRHYQKPYAPWKQQVSRHGFRMLSERGMCWFPFSRSSNSPFIPICTTLERAAGLHRLPDLSPWVVFIARKQA